MDKDLLIDYLFKRLQDLKKENAELRKQLNEQQSNLSVNINNKQEDIVTTPTNNDSEYQDANSFVIDIDKKRTLEASAEVARMLSNENDSSYDLRLKLSQLSGLLKRDDDKGFNDKLRIDPYLVHSRHSESGFTLLHLACDYGAFKIVKLLLNEPYSLDVYSHDLLGRTPLHIAAAKAKTEICDLLLKCMESKQDKLIQDNNNNEMNVMMDKQSESNETGSDNSSKRNPPPLGETAPRDSAGLTPAGHAALMKSQGTEKRIELLRMLHRVGDPCISPSPMKAKSSQRRRTGTKRTMFAQDIFAQTNAGAAVDENKKSLEPCSGSYQIPGFRVFMEDYIFIQDSLHPSSAPSANKNRLPISLYAVFDGHGGTGAAEYCSKNIAQTFSKFLHQQEVTILSADLLTYILRETILDLEGQLKSLPQFSIHYEKDSRDATFAAPKISDGSGTTCVLVAVTNDLIVTANVGDSRAILAKKSVIGEDLVPLTLSRDHKPKEELNTGFMLSEVSDLSFVQMEVDRIENSGAYIQDGNVIIELTTSTGIAKNTLAMTRSIGDFMYKINGAITCDPEISVIQRDINQDCFIILASDGIWDVCTNDYCIQMVAQSINEKNKAKDVENIFSVLEEVCVDFVVHCLHEKQSQDNISMILVSLSNSKEGHPKSFPTTTSSIRALSSSESPAEMQSRTLMTPPASTLITSTTTTATATQPSIPTNPTQSKELEELTDLMTSSMSFSTSAASGNSGSSDAIFL